MKKLLLFSGLIVINCLLDSCGSDSLYCYNLEIISTNSFTLDGNVELATGETTNAEDYAIVLEAEGISETCMTNTYSFGGSLLAEDVAYELVDKVANISITSSGDLSGSYPAGSELKVLFVPLSIFPDCIDNSGSSTECLTNYFIDYDYETLEAAVNGLMSQAIAISSLDEKHLFALIIEEPVISNAHEFTVLIDFDSGVSTELKTAEVILN